MKWLTLIAAGVATVYAIQILAADLRHTVRPRNTLLQLAFAIISLVVLGVAIYGAHSMGLFSVPIAAAAFVPFGLALRWWFMANREKREMRRASMQPIPRTRRDRFLAAVRWPVFFALVALVIAAGLLTAMLTARY